MLIFYFDDCKKFIKVKFEIVIKSVWITRKLTVMSFTLINVVVSDIVHVMHQAFIVMS